MYSCTPVLTYVLTFFFLFPESIMLQQRDTFDKH